MGYGKTWDEVEAPCGNRILLGGLFRGEMGILSEDDNDGEGGDDVDGGGTAIGNLGLKAMWRAAGGERLWRIPSS